MSVKIKLLPINESMQELLDFQERTQKQIADALNINRPFLMSNDRAEFFRVLQQNMRSINEAVLQAYQHQSARAVLHKNIGDFKS